MKALVVEEPGEYEIKEVEVPEPGTEEVLIDVGASGICHSDKFTVEGVRPGIDYPRIPGHEVAGVIEEVGEEVDIWEKGDRVGVGWHGGHCFKCEPCRRGEFLNCKNQAVTGVTRDGGHAEKMVARREALAEMPEGQNFEDAAPIMCAGVTTFQALRHTDVKPGDVVAVQGIGGLGHLGVQYASKAGYETVAVSHSGEKEKYAKELGADHFVDSSKEDISEKLQELGGAKVILCTAPYKEAIESTFEGMGIDGDTTVVGVPSEPLEVEVTTLLDTKGQVSGWSTGHARESQDTLEFSELRDIEPETETFSLEEYREAYEKMMENEIRFRAVVLP